MSHYFIDKHDPRVADLFRRLEKAGKALDKLESSGGRTLKGERFVTDEELSRLLKISRRTLQEYHSLLFDSGQGTIHGIRDTEIPGRFPEEMYRGTGMGIKEERPSRPFFFFSSISCSCRGAARRQRSSWPFGQATVGRLRHSRILSGKPARRSFRANTARQYRRHGCAPGGKPSPHRVCRF